MPERKIKGDLVRQADIQQTHRVLDVGCGTGTLAILIKQAQPQAEVVALDPDPEVLTIARRKSTKSGHQLTFHQGFASSLPFPDDSFDRVLSSFVFHHLTLQDRRLALSEVLRVLRPKGKFCLVDFAKPNKALPSMLADAGYPEIRTFTNYRTLFGTVSLWETSSP
jgi:ubiquinone/menaquinone biosynthesis C-methylase UbiE